MPQFWRSVTLAGLFYTETVIRIRMMYNQCTRSGLSMVNSPAVISAIYAAYGNAQWAMWSRLSPVHGCMNQQHDGYDI